MDDFQISNCRWIKKRNQLNSFSYIDNIWVINLLQRAKILLRITIFSTLIFKVFAKLIIYSVKLGHFCNCFEFKHFKTTQILWSLNVREMICKYVDR